MTRAWKVVQRCQKGGALLAGGLLKVRKEGGAGDNFLNRCVEAGTTKPWKVFLLRFRKEVPGVPSSGSYMDLLEGLSWMSWDILEARHVMNFYFFGVEFWGVGVSSCWLR